MSKSVEFEPGAKDGTTRLVLLERDVYGTIRERRQFTVRTVSLEYELEIAGLYREIQVLSKADEEARLANEIGLYQALTMIQSVPNQQLSAVGRRTRDTLWERITTKLELK